MRCGHSVAAMQNLGTSEILDALDGVAYLTDRDGVLSAAGVLNWDAFSGPADTFGKYRGRNIFDIVAGEEVRAVYRTMHELILKDRRPKIRFEYRCDAPEVRRVMRMTLGPLRHEGRIAGVLYHSQIVSEEERPPLSLLAYDEALERVRGETAPILTICSFCHDVRSGPEETWVTPEEHYRNGGPSRARLSHGVCESCSGQLLEDVA